MKEKKPRLTPEERQRKREEEDRENTFNVFACLRCPQVPGEDAPTFTVPGDFVAHVKECHPELVNPDGKVSGKRRLTAHLDADRWYESNYVWTRDGVEVAAQCVRNPRRGGY